MDLHVIPIPIPPPTSLSTRSLWVFPVHQAWSLVSRPLLLFKIHTLCQVIFLSTREQMSPPLVERVGFLIHFTVHSVTFPSVNIYAHFSPVSSQPRNYLFCNSAKRYSFCLFFPIVRNAIEEKDHWMPLGSLKNFKNLNHLHQAWKMFTDEKHDKQEKI